ncbi:hypothetical protein ACLOJK_026310 [Asimina triloba]
MSSSRRSPALPLPQQHHFSDYGFDTQIDYFQILDEPLYLKLQKPMEEPKKKKKRRWWRNAISFWKGKTSKEEEEKQQQQQQDHLLGRRAFSGPIYETGSGSSTPSRSGRVSSARLSELVSPSGRRDLDTPYVNLRDIDPNSKLRSASASSSPIYLVT